MAFKRSEHGGLGPLVGKTSWRENFSYRLEWLASNLGSCLDLNRRAIDDRAVVNTRGVVYVVGCMVEGSARNLGT